MPVSTYKCAKCGKELPHKSFPPSNSPLNPRKRTFICADCIAAAFAAKAAAIGEWNAAQLFCQCENVPFLPEKWTKCAPLKNKAIVRYFELIAESGSFASLDWAPYEAQWREAVEHNNIAALHPAFEENEIKALKTEWGNQYSLDELQRLKKMYDGIVSSFGVGDPVGEDNAHKLAMMSIEIDKCIASGGSNLEKLVTAYNKIQANGGFTSDNTRDINSFESVSELMLYMEKTGWVEKFSNDTPRDIVDLTIKDIQTHNARLYQSESTIPDQIEERLSAKKRIEEIEGRIANEEIEKHFNETWKADESLLDKFTLPNEEVEGIDEEDEEFNPEINYYGGVQIGF